MSESKRSNAKNNKHSTGLLKNTIAVLVLILVLIVLSVGAAGYTLLKNEIIPHGTTIDDVYIGGLKYSQAQELLESLKKQRLATVNFRFIIGTDHISLKASELFLDYNTDAVLREILHKGEKVGLREYFGIVLASRKKDTVYSSPYIYDRMKIISALENVFSPYEITPVNAQVVFKRDGAGTDYIYEVPGRKANIEQAAAALIDCLDNSTNSVIKVGFTQIRPEVTVTGLESGLRIIGECATQLPDDENGKHNIILACDDIIGILIEPGEMLSLDALIGERTGEKGYLQAPVTLDGKPVTTGTTGRADLEVGAGVSQLAGTLYYAALLADLLVLERTAPVCSSDCLPPGLDACLSRNNEDLKILNTKGFSVYISAIADTDGNTLTVYVYGNDPGADSRVEVTSEIITEISPGQSRVYYANSLNTGETVVVQYAEPGCEVIVRRNYFNGGELLRSEVISHDTYQAKDEIIAIGTPR